MISRERVLTAISHKEPDKVPFDLGGSNISGISMVAYRRLVKYLKLDVDINYEFRDIVQQLAVPDEKVLKVLGIDTRGVFPKNPHHPRWKLEMKENANYRWFVDEYGITWKMPKIGGFYFDPVKFPLANLGLEHLDKYLWPDGSDPFRIQGLREETLSLKKETNAAIVAGYMSAGAFEHSFWLRSYEKFYTDLLLHPEYVLMLQRKLTDVKIKYWNSVLSEVGDLVDIVVETNDAGSEQGPLVSPKLFRKYAVPFMKELYSFIKKKASHVKILFHSCGSVYDVIPDIIETGVDILNPIQVSAKKMDSKVLKKEFGKDLTFWGGIDTQKVLPRGTPEEVRDEVKRRIDEMAPGGGYILGTVHNILADVPPENIVAMYETLQKEGGY